MLKRVYVYRAWDGERLEKGGTKIEKESNSSRLFKILWGSVLISIILDKIVFE